MDNNSDGERRVSSYMGLPIEEVASNGIPLYNSTYSVNRIDIEHNIKRTVSTIYQILLTDVGGVRKISFSYGRTTISKMVLRDEAHDSIEDYLDEIEKDIKSDDSIEGKEKGCVIYAFNILTKDPRAKEGLSKGLLISKDEYEEMQRAKAAEIQNDTTKSTIDAARLSGHISNEVAQRLLDQQEKKYNEFKESIGGPKKG